MKIKKLKLVLLFMTIISLSILTSACERVNYPAIQELNTKAKAALDSGDYATAINRLNASIDIDSNIFETHYNLGIAYTQAGKYPQAIETFNNAIKLKPNFADTYYSLAIAQENYAKAVIDGTINKTPTEQEETSTPQKNLTSQQKTQITKLYTDAITSYNFYIKFNKNTGENQKIQDKIVYLQKEISKYAPAK